MLEGEEDEALPWYVSLVILGAVFILVLGAGLVVVGVGYLLLLKRKKWRWLKGLDNAIRTWVPSSEPLEDADAVKETLIDEEDEDLEQLEEAIAISSDAFTLEDDEEDFLP